MAYIAALGEILIDLTQTDIAPDGTRMLSAFPGGAPANVAVAAARLGASSAFIGKVGADSFGADLTKVLWDNNVDVTGLYTTQKAATTLAIVTVRGGERSFSFYRSPGADTLLTAEEALAPLRGDRRPVFLHLGSLLVSDCLGLSLERRGKRRPKGERLTHRSRVAPQRRDVERLGQVLESGSPALGAKPPREECLA